MNKGSFSNTLESCAVYGAKNPFSYVLINEELQSIKAVQITEVLHSFNNMEHEIIYYGTEKINDLIAKLKGIHKISGLWESNSETAKFVRLNQTSNRFSFQITMPFNQKSIG